MGKAVKVKNFVIDTNVILYSPHFLETLQNNNIIIPAVVLEEVDNFKKERDACGFHARAFIRELESYRESGGDFLHKGVLLPSGGRLFIEFSHTSMLPAEFPQSKHDNVILNVALNIKTRSKLATIIVSKDLNLRIKASAVGIEAQDYYHEKADVLNIGRNGYVDVPGEDVDAIYANGTVPLRKGLCPESGECFTPNDYFILRSDSEENKTALVRYVEQHDGGHFKKIMDVGNLFGIRPLNYKQRFLMDALLDPNIHIVFAVGVAGTGKTLLSLAAGLYHVLTNHYKRIVVSRSPIPMGRDLGFLPGDIEAKIDPWLKPVYDNLSFIISSMNKERAPHGKDVKTVLPGLQEVTIDKLKDNDLLEIEALTYIRGRTFTDTFIVIDEAQNLTPHEAKTIITRAGAGTKIVLIGDPFQIDNPYVDERDNGLVNASEKFHANHSQIASTIFLDRSERSPLADEAARIL